MKPHGLAAARGRASFEEDIEFESWWNSDVVAAYSGETYTRKRIVLDAANKDAGTHVEASLPKRLRILKDGPWRIANAKTGEAQWVQKNLHFQYLRQIAYEVLHSPSLLGLCGQEFSLQSDSEFLEAYSTRCRRRVEGLTEALKAVAIKIENNDEDGVEEGLKYILDEAKELIAQGGARVYCVAALELFQFMSLTKNNERVCILDDAIRLIESRMLYVLDPIEYLHEYVSLMLRRAFLFYEGGDGAGAERSFQIVYQTAEANMSLEAFSIEYGYEVLFHYLMSLNQLSMIQCGRGQHSEAVLVLEEGYQFIFNKWPELAGSWDYQKFLKFFPEKFAGKLGKEVCRLIHNWGYSLCKLEDWEKAAWARDSLRRRFSNTDNELVERMLAAWI